MILETEIFVGPNPHLVNMFLALSQKVLILEKFLLLLEGQKCYSNTDKPNVTLKLLCKELFAKTIFVGNSNSLVSRIDSTVRTVTECEQAFPVRSLFMNNLP